MVTYGAMSMQPLSLPTGLLIFKDLTFKGYWLSGRTARAAGPAVRRAELAQAAQLFLDGIFTPPE
jgi:trans-2-enoyl-CoA reductase